MRLKFNIEKEFIVQFQKYSTLEVVYKGEQGTGRCVITLPGSERICDACSHSLLKTVGEISEITFESTALQNFEEKHKIYFEALSLGDMDVLHENPEILDNYASLQLDCWKSFLSSLYKFIENYWPNQKKRGWVITSSEMDILFLKNASPLLCGDQFTYIDKKKKEVFVSVVVNTQKTDPKVVNISYPTLEERQKFVPNSKVIMPNGAIKPL